MIKVLLLIVFISLSDITYPLVTPSDSGYIQYVGNRTVTFIDSLRSNRNISSLVYYPATAEGSGTPVLTGFRYPLISFGHGFTLNPSLYVALYRHLASWGYIVIAPSTETGFSPSHTNFAKDLVFVLKDMKRKGITAGDIFFNVVDSNYTGVFGHSMGGGCSFLAGSLDTGIKAISSLAAANTNPSSIAAISSIKNPVQLLSGQRDSIASYWSHQLPHYNNAFPFKHIMNIKGGNHSQFHLIAGLDDLVDNPATITRAEQQRLTRRYVTAFFNLFLKNDTNYKIFLYGDYAKADTGIIMQFKNFQLKALIQGFYNEISGNMVSDTVTIYLRSIFSPYEKFDSSVSVLNSSGYSAFSFSKAVSENRYYIQFSHRNSLETWSKAGGEIFSLSKTVYDFTSSSEQAYGNNIILKGAKYCIYNGDVNHDGVIDGTDLSLTDNDSINLISGYINTDLNGDGITDGFDLSLADNNASNIILKITP
jgi:dienelactone hydrolase